MKAPSDIQPARTQCAATMHARRGAAVTVARTPATTHYAAAPTSPAEAPEHGAAPRLADGVELLGEYAGSGYTEPAWLVRRADGQVIQLSRILYLVAGRIDGARAPGVIAELVSRDLGRSLTGDQVGYLVKSKLVPLGIAATGDGPVALPTATPLLALRARATLLPERGANIMGTFFRPLFHWPVVVAVVASVACVDYWLLAVHGVGDGLRQVLRDPRDLLIVAGLSLVSAAFHECGHAAGCRYGGARPGRIGVGIYLVWPSFFTNVTDSYRLSRAGRLRTDLGGLYFNLVFVLGLAGVYVATSSGVVLLVIAVTHLEMLEQLAPFVRFDGYFILSDLAGVPDLFARVGPIIRGVVHGRGPDPRTAGLRRRSRIVVTAWVLGVLPLLAVTGGYLLVRLPALDRALWLAVSREAGLTALGVAGNHHATAAVDAIGGALAALPAIGSAYVLAGLARRVVAASRRWSAGRVGRQLVACAAAVVSVVAIVAGWILQGELRGW
jgi:putative peptide zinc metalloprotease protein